jgi:hypothetical protein
LIFVVGETKGELPTMKKEWRREKDVLSFSVFTVLSLSPANHKSLHLNNRKSLTIHVCVFCVRVSTWTPFGVVM